jgi:hypothetical protein
LVHFTTTKQLNRRQVRWLEELGQYKFRIQYTPRRDNGRADALSRRSDLTIKDYTSKAILKQNLDGTLSLEHYLATIERGLVPEKQQEQIIREYHDRL